MNRALIFDFDGTLVDSEPLHARALAEVFTPLGLGFDPHLCVGLPDADVIMRVFANAARPLPPEELERLMLLKSAAANRLWAAGLGTPYEGSVELLTSARESGWGVAVCTAAMRREAQPVLDRLGVTPLLDAFTTADDVSMSKPHPACYTLTCERLGLDPGRCIAIEDSAAGVTSASAAGCAVVALAHTTPHERLPATPFRAAHISRLTPGMLADWLDRPMRGE